MSTATTTRYVPPLTLGWRLKMALGEHKAEWIAAELGVSRQTISRWMADKGARPARAYLLQWAILTGVDSAWLERGEAPTWPEPGESLTDGRARQESNLQPSDPKVLRLAA